MPLINFRTNLTSLRYGMDRPGGGDSGQPYVKFPIETASTPDPYAKYYNSNRNSLDFPIRGGAISQLVEGGDPTISAAIDTDRIQKFFNDKPRGTAFIQKQTGLGLTNPRMQVPTALEFAGYNLNNVVLPVTQTYNSLNTIAQIRVSGTGAHFNRQGIAPTIYENQKQTYAYIAGDPRNNTESTNRLSILRALKLIGSTNFIINRGTSTGLGIDPDLVDRLGISTIQNQLFNYTGGPGSVYGIGFTRIFRVTDTQPTKDTTTGVAYSNIGYTYKLLAEQQQDRGYGNAYPTPQDFRFMLNFQNDGTSPELATFDYNAESLEQRLKVGNPGGRLTNSNYQEPKMNGQDSVNMRSPFYYNAISYDPWTAGGADNTTDIIKFAFECLDNDNPSGAVGLVFRAFLEGQIQDTNTAEFSTFKYLGRGETFRTYQGFNRSISFTFKVAAQSRQELTPLYTKLNHLISQVYPDYAPSTNIMRGNVVRLTIGDYIYRMPGFLENVNVSIDNSNTPWEIVLKKDEKDVAQLPHFVTIACTFYPIMDLLPRKEKWTGLTSIQDNDNYVPLIANTPTPFLETEIEGVLGNQRQPVAVATIPLAPPATFNSLNNITTRNIPTLPSLGGMIQPPPPPPGVFLDNPNISQEL